MNHLVSVRIDGSVTGPMAHLRGIGNRLPVDVAISVAAALALVADGVPAVVRLADEVDA
jgi:hypothetical protein